MNLNKVFIIGNLTRDPELRQTPSGQPVCSFGMATNSYYTDKSGSRQTRTEFHNIVLWGRQAELANQFLTKGSNVFIEGRLQTRTWEGKDGQQRKTTEIVGERVQFGPKPMGGRGEAQTDKPKEQGKESVDSEPAEEIPVIDIDADEIKPEDLPF
ncbi:MAG: single-stranded DNA-binding protein [Patescibacteria group bacterium]|nr:single-stranded DNA-binding protein [Patescibacteria group bacterium]MDE2144581.1 single-stranded DNA-binding protein [Patescibacteria group bacterium]